MYISKSGFTTGVRCPKMLWMDKNKREEFDPSCMNQAILATGNEVGDLAMGLLGPFKEVTFDKNLANMISETEELLQSNEPIICEASFAYNGLFCSVDILKNFGNKNVEIYEVKSATAAKEINIHDIAFQYYVLTKLGFNVQKVCLVHINNAYVKNGPIDIQKLFAIEDFTDTVVDLQQGVGSYLNYLENVLALKDEPKMDLCSGCHEPYNCGYWAYCSKHLPKPNIFDVAGPKTAIANYKNGIVTLDDIIKNNSVNKSKLEQVKVALGTTKPIVNKEKIKEFLNTVKYPLYFLDFETCQFAIPAYDNSRPFEQIVFQYSLHYLDSKGGELNHKEFLAEPNADPRRAVAEALCMDIPTDVCVMAYNMSFEKTVIKRLSELYPDLSNHLMNIHDNMIDLMEPFKKMHYYTKEMQFSYSIKYVLPALFPNDPELDYHNLEGVHKGDEASAAFVAMAKMSADEVAETRKNLLKYCELDTYAMVKILKYLEEL